jgi:hypothetical protein
MRLQIAGKPQPHQHEETAKKKGGPRSGGRRELKLKETSAGASNRRLGQGRVSVRKREGWLAGVRWCLVRSVAAHSCFGCPASLCHRACSPGFAAKMTAVMKENATARATALMAIPRPDE